MYGKTITVLEKMMDHIARYMLGACFCVILIGAFVIKAMYSFDDSPYFTKNNLMDYALLIIVIFVTFLIIKKKDWLQQKINYKICLVLFVVAVILYIYLVPLIPFSDMRPVYEGAIKFSTFQWKEMLQDDYWNVFPVNIKLAVFWGTLLIPFPKTLVTIKVFNAILLYWSIVLTREISREFGIRYYKITYILMLTFIPLFLYINQVYYDLPVVFFSLLGIYVYLKKDHIVVPLMILGLASYLRETVLIVMIAIIIIHLFKNKEMFLKEESKKIVCEIIVSIVLFWGIGHSLTALVSSKFIQGNFQSYPVWNQYYIGINEKEFGFMDNDFSYDRSAEDVIGRVKEYGPERMSKILIKKTFWLWSQGTYQAQRYAFGNDVTVEQEKFEYTTCLTNHLLRDDQILRRLLNSFMRAQYLVIFSLFIMAIWKKENISKYRLIYYIFSAIFLTMIVYELKSRYILILVPFMIIMAVQTIEDIK